MTHIVTWAAYDSWNTFLAEELVALCGHRSRHPLEEISAEGWHKERGWSYRPDLVPEDAVCPGCRDSPDYALLMLAAV